MIQRIQSLYLLACVVLSVLCIFFELRTEGHPWALTAIMALCLVLEFMAIFLFRRRATQMRFCSFCIILQFGWYGVYVAMAYLMGEGLVGEWRPAVWVAIPAVNVVLLYLAFRGILKDEMLVRSLDRLR